LSTRDNDAESNCNRKQNNREGVPDWFNGDKQKYDRWCFNLRPGGQYDQHVKETEAQLRYRSKHNTDDEADYAEAAPSAQKFCFYLEHEASGSDRLDALSDISLFCEDFFQQLESV
jgi:hypothetical protein